MNARYVDDPRRWAAFHCFGIYAQLMEVQASVEDLEGALDAGQLPVAKYAGMSIVRQCLALRALRAAGVPDEPGDLLGNGMAGLTEEKVTADMRVATRLVQAPDIPTARDAAQAVFDYVREFERELGFEQKPPSVRRPEGLFPALKLAREVLPINNAAMLPLALPDEWLPTEEATDAVGADRGA